MSDRDLDVDLRGERPDAGAGAHAGVGGGPGVSSTAKLATPAATPRSPGQAIDHRAARLDAEKADDGGVVAGQLSTDLLGRGPDASPGGDAAEPEWVTRARMYNASHPSDVAAFAAATGGACDSASGVPDPHAVKRWQREHDLRGDGRIGPKTVAAAQPAAADAAAPADASSPPIPADLDVVELAGYFLNLIVGDGAHAEGAKSIVAAGPSAPAAAPAPEKSQRKGASGGAKKTEGAKDLVETYGTVDEIKKNDLTERIDVYHVDKANAETATEPLVSTTPVHKKAAGLFRAVFASIRSTDAWRRILEPPWAYNARQNRNNATEWSIHSFGTAIDVNPKTNPNGRSHASEGQKEIAPHFQAHGFEWLEKSDAMHFQYHVGGAPLISDDEIGIIQAGKPSKNGKSKTDQLIKDVKHSLVLSRARLAENQAKGVQKKIAQYTWRVSRLEEMLVRLEGGAGEPKAGEP